jgi:hypothetical protein
MHLNTKGELKRFSHARGDGGCFPSFPPPLLGSPGEFNEFWVCITKNRDNHMHLFGQAQRGQRKQYKIPKSAA